MRKRDTDTHTQSIIILCISNRIFMSLSELEYFNISSNKLDSIKAPPHSCPRLVCLIIHSNKLKEFPVFPLMPSVETLDLSCNELQTMPQVREMLIFYMYWIISAWDPILSAYLFISAYPFALQSNNCTFRVAMVVNS